MEALDTENDQNSQYPIMSDKDVGIDSSVKNQLPSGPQVPNGSSYPTYSDQDVGIAKPSLTKQVLFPSLSSGNILDAMSQSGDFYQSAKNVAAAFGESVKQTKDDIVENLTGQTGGDLVQSMRDNGIFDSYVDDQQSFDKAHAWKTAGPATLAFLDKTIYTPQVREIMARVGAAATNLASAPMNAIGSAMGQATEELPEGPVKELADYAMNSPLLAETHELPVKEALQDLMSRVPRRVAEGEAAGVIGTTEGQNEGVEPLSDEQHVKQTTAASEVRDDINVRAAPEEQQQPENAPQDIHDYARAIDPETFQEYDKLSANRDSLRSQLSSIDENTPEYSDIRNQIQDTNSQLRDLSGKVSDAYLHAQTLEERPESVINNETDLSAEKDKVVSDRNVRDDQGRLLNPVKDPLFKALDEATSSFYSESSNIEALKWAVDNGRDDIASKLLGKAQKHLEMMQDAAKQDPTNFSERVKDAQRGLDQANNLARLRAEERGRPLASKTSGVEPAPEMKEELAEKVSPIVSDITKKLTDLGYGADEAKSSGEVAARMYQYFADVYGGEKGTAQDWYNREKTDIVPSKERATVLAQKKKGEELSQRAKGSINLVTENSRALIKLMSRADASTFVHESAHHFLDMMDRFSQEDGAPDQLKIDMDKIRKWTGLSDKDAETAKEEKQYVRAQEKFARGFERYLMEGVAPNRDMALIFAKFKKWMNAIYKSVRLIPDQRGGINEDIRQFFDRVMSTTPERTVIVPDIDLKNNISSPKLNDLFTNVPKPPQSLAEWLASKGGIKDDDAGDLRAMDADKAHIDLKTGKPKPFAKKLVKDTGMDLDDAANAAHEAGYFPEKGNERPSVEDLKEKLLEDLSGNKQYSDKDHEELNNHIDALKYNAEIEKVAHDTGVSSIGKSHDQFWDDVDKHYQEEKRYNEAQEIASNANDEFEEFERQQKEFIESRGDAWKPPKEPDVATLEGMENERKQEQVGNDASGSIVNPQEPGSATVIGQSGEEGGEQIGRSPESDGRAGQEIAEREAAARQQLDAARSDIANAPVGDTSQPDPSAKSAGEQSANDTTAKSEYFDKAGNVRLDLLTDSDSVKAAMREAAEKNPQIFNHDVITDAQVAEFADSMGIDAKNLNIQKLRELSVNDDIPLAARIRSGSQFMIEALNKSLELMNKSNPTDEDAAKFLEAKNQFMMIAETVSATTNEMGRGLRAYANIKKEYNLNDMEEITELFQRMTGRTLDDVKKEMKAGSKLKTAKQAARYAQDSFKPDFMDKLIEYRNNSLLSGPVTHTMYTAGGFFNAAYKPLQTLAGLGVQAGREVLGGEITERMYAKEALAQFTALGYGSMRGLKAAAESWKQNAELALPKEIASAPLLKVLSKTGLENIKGAGDLGWLPRRQAIDGKLGAVINSPSRLVGSIHSFQKMLNYQQEIARLAVRDALDKSFDPKSDEYTKYVSDMIDKPTTKMMDAAGEASLKEVYREKVDYNSLPGKLFNLVNSNAATKVLFPFIKMQYNIKRLAFRDNSVLGFLSSKIRADVSGVNGDIAKNMAIGKISAGTAIAGLGINMTMQGMNNGGGPSDPKAYKTWRLTHTPYAVQVGSIVIPHRALGTLGQLLSWSGDLAEGAHEFDSKDIEKSAWHFVQKAGSVFTEEGFLTQAKNTLDAAFTPQQFGTRFIQNFATQWLPMSVGASQTNRLLGDPYSRMIKSEGAANAWGIPEAMAYKYPGTSELLHVNRDMFGQPIETGTFTNPGYDKYANDPVVRKLESLQTGIGRLKDSIKGIPLTEQQYDDYSRIAGQTTYAKLSKLVNQPNFDKMPPQHQLQLIEKNITECRNSAANQIIKMNHEIIQKSREKKRLSIYGSPKVNEAEETEETEDTQNP